MAFYVIEKSSQLPQFGNFGDCFIRFIPKNNNFHPSLTKLSLIYLRPLDGRKGYIFCLDHSESFSLKFEEVFDFISKMTLKLFVLDKKEAMNWWSHSNQLFDINFIEHTKLDRTNHCIAFYYKKFYSLSNVNCLIPISKHYEESEELFIRIKPIIDRYDPLDIQYRFNNTSTTEAFFNIEINGIKCDKNAFILYYKENVRFPEFNLSRSKLHSKYNLYTTTSRPSNSFNGMNFAAIPKDSGERECYIAENDILIELDFQGYHPRLIGELVDYDFPKRKNTYDILGEVMGVNKQEAKELTFKQLYGGVADEYKDKPFFNDIVHYIDGLWMLFSTNGFIKTENRVFAVESLPDMTPQKLFSYLVQSYETSTNVKFLNKIQSYLKGKNTKLILYTYDSFLFDYSEKDGDIIEDLKDLLDFPVTIKKGINYNQLEKI